MSFYCSLCEKNVKKKTESSKNDHAMIHINGPCSCQIYEVSTNFECRTMVYTKEGKMPIFPYKCNICSKTFVKKYFVRSHIMTVHENVKFKCGRCLIIRYNEDNKKFE